MCNKRFCLTVVAALCLAVLASRAMGDDIVWDFENGNDHGFALTSLVPATPAADKPDIAGDEKLTGVGGPKGLPGAGIAWVVSDLDAFVGMIPAVNEGQNIVNGRLVYQSALPKAKGPSQLGQSGYLNTYALSVWGDGLHTAANDQIAGSPLVELGEGSVMTVHALGGQNIGIPVWDADASQGYARNCGGIAVISLAGEIVTSIAMPSTNWRQYTVDLSNWAGQKVYIEVVDAFDGAWGWMAVDQIKITNASVVGDSSRPLAKRPNPANGAIGVMIPLLQWMAGEGAVTHRVSLGTTPDLGPDNVVGPMQPMTMFFVMQPLVPGTTYYWRVDEIEADMTTVHTGNVWSFTTRALTAYLPTPTDGDVNVSPSPELSWFAGQNAIKHQVYFSDGFTDVNEGAAAADKGVLTATTTFAPGDLGSLTTYYWRVDEILFDGTVRAGVVWSFATCGVVEDFESYTDDEGSRVYEAWIDGWVNGTGATVGYINAPFAEQMIVHGGAQSMPLDYNNVNPPFHSEAGYEWEAAQDWTADGIGALVVYVRGQLSNAVAPLYLAIEDTSQSSSAVLHPDPAVVKKTGWVEWRIPLTEFAGVNLARVKKIIIGVGDRENPAAGGRGLLYVDDIRVTKP